MFESMFRPRSRSMAQTAPEVTPEAKPQRLTGSIRALKQGFGFIAGDDGSDYFFHWSAMDVSSTDFRDLVIRERVSFRVEESARGTRAVEIVVSTRSKDA